MSEEQNSEEQKDELKNETRGGIRKVSDLRDHIAQLEQKGIPRQHDEYEDLREEIHILLDHLIIEGKIDLETSHLVRTKLRRIADLFVEMEREGHFAKSRKAAGEQMDYDKERQDSKLEVVELMLGQVYPKLRKTIGMTGEK